MNLIIFIFIPLVHSALHTFITTYTEKHGQTTTGIPEISSVTVFDGEQIDYYDGEKNKLIYRQHWMEEFASTETWKKYTEIRERVQETNKINIRYLMKQFNHLHGVHAYERRYGCDWDEETGHSNWFDQHGYDGEDFISLDVENSRYIAAVPQAYNTMTQWNNDTAQINSLRRYYRDECVHWMMYFMRLKKVDLEKREHKSTIIAHDVIYVFIAIFMFFVVLNICTKVLVWRKRKGFQRVSQTDDGIYMYINKGL